MSDWTKARRARTLITLALVFLVVVLLYIARSALLPFVLGVILAYIVLPIVNWLHSRAPSQLRKRPLSRTLAVALTYVLLALVLVGALTLTIQPIAAQVNFLVQELPDFARKVYGAVPEAVQVWWDRYKQIVPANIQLTLQRSIDSMVQSLVEALQAGVFKTVGVAFSTVSFVFGLIIVPLWTFYLLRDQPRIAYAFYRRIPAAYREDVRNVQTLIDTVLGAYLRGQLILSLSVGIMTTGGLLIIGVDLALLLGTIVGILEIIPTLGPMLGAIPVILVTLATSPSKLLWAVLLAVAVQQVENLFLVPQVASETVKLHPALVMLVLVIGSAVAGIWGVILGVPITAVLRDVVRYLYLRLSDEPLSPHEAMARLRAQS